MASGSDQHMQTEEVEKSGIQPLHSVWEGRKLHPAIWKPAETAKALVFISHGVGEHMGRYEELGTFLAHNGILVFGHDHVGHGHSEGDRVHVEDIDTYIQDVINHIELMKNKHPHLPCVLMGHSMGALIAGHVAIQRSDLFTSLILSGTAAEFEARLSTWIVSKMFQLLGRVVPQLGVKYIDTNDISSLPEEVERYVNDPQVWHGPLKARWGVEFVSSITLFRENVAKICLPLLLIHGSDDNLVPITSSHFIYDNVSSQEKKFEILEGSRHETLHDKDQERVRELIKDWVMSHLIACPTSESQSAESQPEDLTKPQLESCSTTADDTHTQKEQNTDIPQVLSPKVTAGVDT